jgi:stearoyl-CoA desaturase (delta-9 desaturase)
LAWYEIDPNYIGIWLLAHLGLARKVQVTKLERKRPRSTAV